MGLRNEEKHMRGSCGMRTRGGWAEEVGLLRREGEGREGGGLDERGDG